MSCLISFVSVVGMSSLVFIGADRADPMPSEYERQGRSSNIFFFHDCLLQGHYEISNLLTYPIRNYSMYFIGVALTDDLVNDAHERRGSIDDNAVFRNVSFVRCNRATSSFSSG